MLNVRIGLVIITSTKTMAVFGRGNAGRTTSEWTFLSIPELLTGGLLQTRMEEDFCWIVYHVPPITTQSVKGLN